MNQQPLLQSKGDLFGTPKRVIEEKPDSMFSMGNMSSGGKQNKRR